FTSRFQWAIHEIKDKNIPYLPLPMSTFRSEFPLKTDQLKHLRGIFQTYTNQSALKQLIKNDLFGTKVAPIGLYFLKFLINDDQHQALFNIEKILGQTFYVINDIESKQQPVKIKLFFSTNNLWQLLVYQDNN
ncbi:hypothetical protein OAB57_03605, partial [Bacteriovoracaceae bacterium]|nr:hypothetical protein [Bacteriovoracaceae bacterium]